MAVTKEQMAKWSKNFEARYPNEKKNTGTGTQTRTQTTAVRQVTAAQMNQWEQGYQTMQANREREERNRTSPMTNKVTLAQQAAARNPAQTGTAAQSRLPASVTAAKQPEWTNGTRKVLGTVTADELARNVLGYMDEPEKSHTGSPVKTDRQEDYEPDWNYAGNDNTPKQRAIAQGTYGSYAKAAQTAGNLLSKDRQTDRFDELNQWMDADPKNRELVNLLRQKKTNYTSYAQEGTSAPGSTAPGGGTTGKTYAERGTTQTDGDRWNTEAKYTDAQLRAKGYTQQQINEARQYLKEYSAFNPAETLTRRTADTAKGILATVVSAVPMAGEDAVQAVKNETATTQNWKELQESVQGDARQKELLRLMTSGKVRYAETSHAMQPSGVAEEPKSTAYTDRELIKKGYSQDEIDAMRQRIAGVKVRDAVDQDTSLGYQLYHYGQQRTAAAQAGLSPAAQTAAGIAASAAENLAVAGVSPYLVLPVLSAQGAAESMGQSMERGDSAGTALATGLAKFGAGWAINSVAAADLAKTMGADYAKETVAGRIADFVRGLSGSSEFAKAYPVVANAISGGIDNAMQAFVETYADTAIDAVLGGDQESAEALLKPETFLQAVQSGLTGGASGALGGAVGTGLRKMNAVLEERSGPTRQERAKQAQELAERMLEPGEMEQQASPAEERQEAAPAAQTEQPGETVRAAEQPAVQAVQSDNAAVQRYAAAVQADSLTNKTLDLFTPKAANAENRAALAEAYGVELPATASETRRMLRQLAQEQRTAAETETGELAQTAEPMQTEPAAQVEAPAADPGQSTVEKAGESVESGQGYSVSMSNDTMTVRFADGTEAVRKIDPENPRTMLFDPEQLHRQAQAESRAEAPQEIPAVQQTEARADGMRETLGMTRQTLNQKQYSVQKELERWKVSRGASETISRMVPDSISDLNRYTTAASSLYRMGQMEGVKSFDQALKLAGGMNNLAPNTNYVLQQPGGRVALEAAWTQGRGELEAGTLNSGMLGGALSEKSTKGEGRVFWRNSARAEDRVGTQLIALNARGTGTDAILKSVLRGPDGAPSARVKAYVETETGRIFFGDAVDDVFGTILHEDLHWYNALDQEGAAGFQDQALEYLANGLGFENVDEMIRGKLNDYAAQGLTYNQAAEELIADAVGGIFTTPEDVTRFAEFQRAQAEKNEGKAGTIHKVMNAVKEMLNQIIGKAKEVLTLDPENKAALKAQRLAEAEKKALQDAYFAHAEKAMDNLRAAKENAAALKSEGAAKGVRFQLQEGEETLEKQLYDHLEQLSKMEPVSDITGKEIAYGETNKENAENIVKFFEFIGGKVERTGFGVVELSRKGAKATVQHGNGPVKQIAAAAIPDVIRHGQQIGFVENWKGRGYNTYTFVAPVTVGETTVYEAVVVNEYRSTKQGNKFYVHEVCGSDGSLLVLDDTGHIKQKQESADTVLKTEEGVERPSFPADTSIAQASAESKENNEAVQKNVRFQLAEQANRDARKDDQRQASRAIADTAAALDTLSEFFGVTRGVKLSQDSLDGLAARWTKANGSHADRAKLANEARVLAEYLTADGADMTKAQSLAETLAGEVLDGATYRDSELWDEYPDLHKLEYTVNKNGSAKAELVKAYGSWSEAVAEARRHGVTLRQAEGVRDGNPAEQYESVINDTRAVGGIRDGEKAIWKAAAQQAGVDGAQSMESTEWLDVLMNLHDAIKPKMMSRFADDAEYEDARVELAGRMIGDIMNAPEMTDAEAIFEGMQRQGLQMARAAAGTEAGADEVSQGLKAVQKAQRQEFRRRLAANQRAGARDTAVQIDGRTFTNMGDLNEYITYQREEFQRQLKQQAKRLKAERQEALDEAKLFYHERMGEMREENDYLADQVKQEQRRADRAERSLIIQENEIMEWEAENERRREAWQQKQAQRNAIAIETARQQRDEDVAIAKRVAERRVQKARDARKMDEMRRSIRQNSAQLNQMLLRPSKDKYVQRGLIVQAAEVAKLADQVILNQKAVNQLTALEDSIRRAAGSESAPNAMTEDWKQSGVEDMIKALRDDLTASRQARLNRLQEQLAEAEALPDSEKARMLQDRLRQRIRETENRTYLPLTVDQMRLLKTITSSTLHVVRTANKTLSLAKAEEVDAIAQTAAREVLNSKGNRPGGSFDGVRNALTKYQLDMLGGERVFRMLGGYAKDGQMEKLARMLNDGQRKQTKITLEGERLFDNVTGKTHRKEMNTFAGPGAEMVDIGLTDTKGNAVPLTHAMLCSLYMHLQNQDSREHLLTGGLTVPNMKQYAKGNIERAYQEGQTVQIGMLKDADGMPMTETILEKVENALTEYDRAWTADMKDFFGRYTTNLINETSMQLLGYNRAEVKNYYPIAVDKSELATQIEGLNLDATIEGRGFLKNRVKSSKAIMLEECSSVVQRSLRDTAAYAGLALPIRDVQKVLNSTVETEQGIGNLKNGILKEQWGRSAVEYINDLLTDLQTTQRRRDNGVSRAAARLRGSYAGAILTLNPGVAIAQAASLPTAGAVLGADTMAAVVPFVKNLSTKQRTALETEIREHGDVLLDWRKRGSQQDELSDIGKDPTLAEKAMDKLPKALTGWINGMDEVTVAALWEGSKAYVKNHADEFAEGAAKEGSEDYWQAVNQTYQKVIEQTQPNYTTMQRAGIQRNPDEFVKAFTMFTTQRFQNYGILADAVMDYNAQKARYDQSQTAETLAEKQRAGKQLQRAAVSQVAQTAVFALMKIGADFLLHRWDREQDENGDVTLKSLLSRFTGLFTESAAGNFLYGSEVYSLVDNALNGKDYDVVSATNISAVNDLAGDVTKFVTELRKDTSDMDETKLAAHHGKVEKYALALMEDGMEIAGVPFGNGRKIVEAFKGYVQDIENAANGKAFRFSSLPASATGQYDRLYNAYRNGDTAEAKAAMEKLDGMGKADEVYKQLKARLVKYDETVQKAAQAQVNGSDAQREQLTRQVIRELYDVLGIRTGVKADADKREAVIDCVTGAVSSKANELLKNGNSSATDDLVEALDSGRAQDVQEELDRLLRAGKSVTSLKSKITEVCKPDYLAGSAYDREQMAEMLLRLTDADGKALYEQKTLDGWVKQAEKAAAAAEDTADPYADLR